MSNRRRGGGRDEKKKRGGKYRERKWTETNGHGKWPVQESLPTRQNLSAALTLTDRPTRQRHRAYPFHLCLILLLF